jgi:glycosyltransferase involved in cell wall biosynthesis
LEIVVNTRLLIKDKLDGIGWFTYETLKRITRDHPDDHFVFAFDRQPDPEMIFSDNITPLVMAPQARHPVLFWIWFEFSVGRLLKDFKPDLFLSPDGYLPLTGSTKKLAVIHDLNFAHYPTDLPWAVRSYYNYFFPRFAAQATRIATVSEFSKQDIRSTYGIADDKIDVVFNGADPLYVPDKESTLLATRKKYAQSCPYFLFVGSLHPRKNIGRLLQAFSLFKDKESSPIKLLIVGHRYWWTSELEDIFRNLPHKDEVIFTGRLPQAELYHVMAAAFALTYIPYFEGFGIPLLEAMNSDVPVLTANASSLPEVAGGAALLVDPFSVEDISRGMHLLVTDVSTRKNLIEAGRIRKSTYSWDRTAALLWESMERTVESRQQE